MKKELIFPSLALIICLGVLMVLINVNNKNNTHPIEANYVPCDIETKLFLLPANTEDGKILQDTYYKVWMDDFYLGEYDAQRNIPVNLTQNLTEEKINYIKKNYNESILDGNHRFSMIVDVRQKDKKNYFIYNNYLEYRSICDSVQFIKPILKDEEKRFRRIYYVAEDGMGLDNNIVNMYSFDEYRLGVDIRNDGLHYSKIICQYDIKQIEEVVPKVDYSLLEPKSVPNSIPIYEGMRIKAYQFPEYTRKFELLIKSRELHNTTNITCMLMDEEYFIDEYGNLDFYVEDDLLNELGAEDLILNIQVNEQ